MYGNGVTWGFPFLPFGAEMLFTETYPNQPLIRLVDLDQDGKNEVIGVYRLNQQLFLFVLKERYGHLRLISSELGHGFHVSYLGVAHIKSPDILSIVVGWQFGAIWSQLAIYDWKRAGIKRVNLNGDFSFSRIEIEDMPSLVGRDGKDEIALWLHDTGEAYRVYIYRWDEGKLVRAKDVEPYYFKKVAAYYRQKLAEHPDYTFYTPYLQDALEKAGLDMRTVYLFPASRKEVGGTKWGYIDTKGKFILPPIYDDARDFEDNDLAIVSMGGHYGVIDSKGYFVVKPKYETIGPFSEGRAVVTDQQGTKAIDESGKEITSRSYSNIHNFQEGRALIEGTNETGDHLYGYLNRMGKEVIPLQYTSAGPFHEGKAVVKLKDGKTALINLTGNIIKKYPYLSVNDYSEGLMAFKQTEDGKYGYIDEQGNIVIWPEFTWAEPFVDGKAIIRKDQGKSDLFGMINKKGKFIIKPNYTILLDIGEGMYSLGKANNPDAPYKGVKYAIADSDGRILTGFIFSHIGKYQDGFASVTSGQYTFFINKNGIRVEHLPKVIGEGELKIDKTLVKGDIDGNLIYLNLQGELVWKQNTVIPLRDKLAVVEHKYYPNKDYLVLYPQLSGMVEVNKQLKEMAGVRKIPSDVQLDSTYSGDFDVTFFEKNLLVIEISGYDYTLGAAHGMPIQKYAHINIENEKMYQLKDLFKQDADYVKIISGIIGDMIKSDEQYSDLFPNSYKGIAKDQSFFINKSGLNIYFTPYDIGPFAAGFPTFPIPFEELKQVIDYSSEFWKSFH